jgi:hypothetical protein
MIIRQSPLGVAWQNFADDGKGGFLGPGRGLSVRGLEKPQPEIP